LGAVNGAEIWERLFHKYLFARCKLIEYRPHLSSHHHFSVGNITSEIIGSESDKMVLQIELKIPGEIFLLLKYIHFS
jgi:hypothetical protein